MPCDAPPLATSSTSRLRLRVRQLGSCVTPQSPKAATTFRNRAVWCDVQCEIVDPARAPQLEAYVERLVEVRRKKNVTHDMARDLLNDPNYFGTVRQSSANSLSLQTSLSVGRSLCLPTAGHACVVRCKALHALHLASGYRCGMSVMQRRFWSTTVQSPLLSSMSTPSRLPWRLWTWPRGSCVTLRRCGDLRRRLFPLTPEAMMPGCSKRAP